VREVLGQLGREEADHVEGAPEDVAMAAGKEVAGLYGVVHQIELHKETVFLVKDATLVWGHAAVSHDDGRPAGPDVDRKLHDQFAVLHRAIIIAHAADRWDADSPEGNGIGAGEKFAADVGLRLGGVESFFWISLD